MKKVLLSAGALLAAACAFGSESGPASLPRRMTVAFVVTSGANVMDFAGPWEVFQDAGGPDGGNGFALYTVSDSREPVTMTGGLRLAPQYTFANAPKPDIVVVGAQRGSDAMREWLKNASASATVMSVCTGAFQVAKIGLFDGLPATTHHDFFDRMAKEHPRVKLQRGLRWVQASDRLYSAGGLTSGIDLALHLVAKLLGDAAAERTAYYMEHSGDGWKIPTATPVRGTK